MDAAAELGGDIIAVLGAADDSAPTIEQQRRAMADNLRWAGDTVAARNMKIGLEPMIALPNMALKSWQDGLEMIERTAHPAVQLIFDTGHVHDLDREVAAALEASFDHVCLMQFADQPGRVEPGAGAIDFPRIMSVLEQRRYAGLIELEHGWRDDSVRGEYDGLDRLRRLDRLSHEQ
jgi:hydroxypyruvate isomerase